MMRPIAAIVDALYELQNTGRLADDTKKVLEDLKVAEYYEHPVLIESLKKMHDEPR